MLHYVFQRTKLFRHLIKASSAIASLSYFFTVSFKACAIQCNDLKDIYITPHMIFQALCFSIIVTLLVNIRSLITDLMYRDKNSQK